MHIGVLTKLFCSLANPVEYSIELYNDSIRLNDFLLQDIQISLTGIIYCIHCKRKVDKNYNGYCIRCKYKLACCDLCIVKPELCHYHHGTCREPSWGLQNCFVPHIVYLANTSAVKIGITKETNVPSRWLQQGALSAISVVRIQNRRDAGLIEQHIAQHILDKTNWRKMLMQNKSDIDLLDYKQKLLEQFSTYLQDFSLEILSAPQVNITYPGQLQIVKSLDLYKESINSCLVGIKGQYLLFKHGVVNLRKYIGHEIKFTKSSSGIIAAL